MRTVRTVAELRGELAGDVVTFASVDGQTCFGGVQSNQGAAT